MNDGDSLVAVVNYWGYDQLMENLRCLGIEPVIHSTRPPDITCKDGASCIEGTRWCEQPGHTEIMGNPAFIWCTSDNMEISVASSYVVMESDVQNAIEIEKVLRQAPFSYKEPPVDDKHCLCPKYYPEYYK